MKILLNLLCLFTLLFYSCSEDGTEDDIFGDMPKSWEKMYGDYNGNLTIFYNDDSQFHEDIIFTIIRESDYLAFTFSSTIDIGVSVLKFEITGVERTIEDNGYIYFDVTENQFCKSRNKYEDDNRFNFNINPIVAPDHPRINMRLKLIHLSNSDIRQISIFGTKYL